MVRRLLIISACVVAGGVLAPVLLVKLIALLCLGDWNASLTSFDQIVYKPSVDAVGDVRCRYIGQSFILDTSDGDVVVGILPRKEGDTEYELHISASFKLDLVEEIESVASDLAVVGRDGQAVGPRLLDLRPTRERPIRRGPRHGSYAAHGVAWTQDYTIVPDLDPVHDASLLLRLSVVYLDIRGERHTLDVEVPLEPLQTRQPGSVV